MLVDAILSIFEAANYDIIVRPDYGEGYDFIVKKENCYVVEVKARSGSLLIPAAEKLVVYTNEYNRKSDIKAKPMLIVADRVDEMFQDGVMAMYKDVILVDISQLLYCVSENEAMRNKLLSCLDYTVDGILLKKWDLVNLNHSDTSNDDLKNKIKNINKGIDFYQEYEKICVEILTYLFNDVLCPIHSQVHSNNKLYRFDAIARIKSGQQKDFWSIIQNEFNTRFIVIEFKNYEERINQSQIYTTEKYLYGKALRRVCLLISRNGPDDSAEWAAKGCLRENGKLIINLCDDNLIKMMEMKESGEDPSDYLMELLEDMLVKLEK